MTSYTHTQRGMTWVFVIAGITPLIVGVVLFYTRELDPISAGIIIATAILAPVFLRLMGSLTVTITDKVLSFHFGPGLIRKQFQISEIARATAVRNPWYYGWGIHLTPRGWLYNVAGFDAVEITMRDGRSFRLGTDEPGALLAAIEKTRAPR